ncbi:MAG: hypothetical protein DMG02_24605 [Acidobacteria bacterium]|nr:MAG: hypothetical protein DMG02_24605 [Acidobacteriota bacterium]PYR02427.1 MAG: hypothetical protein DMG00_28900 [Acidobacteriota bacterium]PYR04658.1 MAG: hypothetical protein DMF99_31270 [Acidobacteriota bacterium]
MSSRRTKSVLVILSFIAIVMLTGSGDAPAAALATSVTVPISGNVDGLPESVSLSGSLSIASTFVTDPLLATPKVRLVIKLVDVSGVGLTSGAKYVAVGEDRILRLLSLSDRLEIMFPFYRATTDGRLSARSAMATITLKFDLLTGSLTGATATFSSPKLAG